MTDSMIDETHSTSQHTGDASTEANNGPLFTLCRITLTTTSALAVGSSAPIPGVNRPIATTPQGNPWVPPSSIAGALREHLDSCGLDANQFMGGTLSRRADSSDPDRLTPSMIRVMHTALDSAGPDIAQQTRINARTGAAAEGSLRTSQQLPPGATITVDLLIDGHHHAGSELIDALSSFGPQLGAGTTNGMGRTETTTVAHGLIDLASTSDFVTWMTVGGPDLFSTVATNRLEPSSGRTDHVIHVECEIVDPMLIAPRIDGNTATSSSILAGSSIKGVFRHRAEFILNSVAESDGISMASATIALEHLFGCSDRRGRVRFDDAHISSPTRERRPHVAIDRFTGGATDGRLFDEEVIAAGRLTIAITPLDELEQWEVDLLDAVIADVNDGYVAFGARTARGCGTVRVLNDPGMPDLASVAEKLHDVEHEGHEFNE